MADLQVEEKSSLCKQKLYSRSFLLNFYVRTQYHKSQYEILVSEQLFVPKL